MAEPLDTDVAIESPEHIVFRYRLAGPTRRALAQVVDLLLCYGTLALLAAVVFLAVLGRASSFDDVTGAAKAAGGLFLVALFAAQWLYFVVWEALTGRTPGKAALGLRVVTTSGRPIGVRAAALRNLLRAADLLPTGYLVGFVATLVSSRFQRLGDLVAGTMVVVPTRPRGPELTELDPPATPDELAALPRVVPLDADERAAIELFLRRRKTLGRAREHELASVLAKPLAARIGADRAVDPARLLALLHHRSGEAGRSETARAERRREDWDALDALATRATGFRGARRLAPVDAARLPPLFRSACADLAAAEAARASAPLVEYLRGLTASAHAVLYGPHARGRDDGERLSLGRAWAVAFPQAVRRRHRPVALAAVLFFAPFALGVLLVTSEPTMAYRIVPEAMLRPLAEAYARGFDAGRSGSDNALMTGFYVYNNVGIALRCFATGVFGGLGSAFYLVQNGLSIGATLGYVASQGAAGNIVTFIVGHGTLELGAIVLAGGAGLSLGWSIVAPGELPRLRALQETARDVVIIVFGAAVMLVMAAMIEGFWSASSTPAPVKLAVGATLFALVLAYVTLAGRGEPGTRDTRNTRGEVRR